MVSLRFICSLLVRHMNVEDISFLLLKRRGYFSEITLKDFSLFYFIYYQSGMIRE